MSEGNKVYVEGRITVSDKNKPYCHVEIIDACSAKRTMMFHKESVFPVSQIMKHYGVWVTICENPGWLIDESGIIFCTTSKAHAQAQIDAWTHHKTAEVKEFENGN